MGQVCRGMPEQGNHGRWRVSELASASVWPAGFRKAGKWHLPAFSPLDTAPSDPHPSGTLVEASKSL